MVKIEIPDELIYLGAVLGVRHCIKKRMVKSETVGNIVARIINGYIYNNKK